MSSRARPPGALARSITLVVAAVIATGLLAAALSPVPVHAGPKVVKPFAPGGSTTITPGTTETGTTKDAPEFPWRELDEGLAEAKKAGKPLLVDVVTDWCGWCKRMDRTTYGDTAVRDYVTRSFVPVRLDAEEEGRRATYNQRLVTWRQFADGFGISGYPTTVFLTADGSLITTVPGFVQPERFLDVLKYVGDGHYKKEPWDVYDKNRRAEKNN